MAKCLINMAIIQTDQGDHFGGIRNSLRSRKMLKKNDSITRQLNHPIITTWLWQVQNKKTIKMPKNP